MAIWDIWGRWDKWRRSGLTAKDEELYRFLGGGETWAGEKVSTHGALNLSAFWACVKVTAQTVATLPLPLYERLPDGEKRQADHPLQRLLRDSPNADQTAVEFWEGRVLGLCTSGNGFAEKVSGRSGLVALLPMPADTTVRRTENGTLEYKFNDRGKEVKLPEEKVFHIKAFGDGDVGMSPVTYARQTLSLAIATEKMAGQAYAKGGRSKGFFVMPSGSKPLTPEQRADAKKTLVDANSGPNAPWAGILEAGVDWKTVSLSMRDAEMILNRRFNVEEVCRWIGVPPIIVGHASDGQTMWGTGVDAIMQSWLTLSLRAYLKRIEQAISKRLLTPAEQGKYFAEFNVEGLLRGDSTKRAEFYSKMVQNAGMTPNEMRGKENLPRMEGGDQLLANSTLVPLAMLGQKPEAGSNGGAAPQEAA